MEGPALKTGGFLFGLSRKTHKVRTSGRGEFVGRNSNESNAGISTSENYVNLRVRVNDWTDEKQMRGTGYAGCTEAWNVRRGTKESWWRAEQKG